MYFNTSNITVNSNISTNQTQVYSNISDILNCVNVVVAVFGVVAGCFVANIVRKLDDHELRSRFSLLSVLVCDVILAFSNLFVIVSVFLLIDRERFSYLKCHFIVVNYVLSAFFILTLAMTLLCLAVDQVIAVFHPLYFRTSDATRRSVVYGSVICVPIPLIAAGLAYETLMLTKNTNTTVDFSRFNTALIKLSPYLAPGAVLLAVFTPVIYGVVLWKISNQQRIQSSSHLESNQNRRLVLSFFILSASYFLLWIPTLIYFGVCFIMGNVCWEEDSIDVSLIMHVIFTLNYIVDPFVCAVRMEPIKRNIRMMFS